MRISMWLGLVWFVGALAVAVSTRPRRLVRELSEVGQSGAAPLARSVTLRKLKLQLPLRARRQHRENTATSARELADVIDLFALAIASGLNLRLAVVAVSSRAPPSWTGPLHAVVSRVERGIGVADALDQLPDMTGEHVHPLVSALVSSERYGTALLPALERLAGEARIERRRRAEEAARRLPVKLLFPLVLCILPAFGALTVAPLLAGALGSLRLD